MYVNVTGISHCSSTDSNEIVTIFTHDMCYLVCARGLLEIQKLNVNYSV